MAYFGKILLLSGASLLCLNALGNRIPLRSLDKPNWGFKQNDKDPSKSLLFDQVFDEKSYRPFPQKASNATIEKDLLKNHSIAFQAPRFSPFVSNKNWKPVTLPKKFASAAPMKFQMPPKIASEFELKISEDRAIENEKLIEEKLASSLPQLETEEPEIQDNEAAVWVLDESSLLNNKKIGVPDAKVFWIHPNASLNSQTDKAGVAKFPFKSVLSSRYIISAPGYMPAVGYVVRGQVSPVLMVRDERLGPILKSLKVSEKSSVVLGKLLDQNNQPVDNVILDLTDPKPASAHFALGGLFNTFQRKSGSKGLFLAAGLGPWLQYLMPTRLPSKEWAPALLNLEGLPREVSMVIRDSAPKKLTLSISDSVHGTRPETPIHSTLGGQRGVFIPDTNGFINIPSYSPRSFVDLLEIKAEGYMNTWVSLSNNENNNDIPLFSLPQLKAILPHENFELNRFGVLLGRIQSRNLPIYNVDIELINSFGQKNKTANIHYFDQKEFIKDGVLRFAVTNLEPGEWHVLIKTTDTQDALSIAVVRVESDTISQVVF